MGGGVGREKEGGRDGKGGREGGRGRERKMSVCMRVHVRVPAYCVRVCTCARAFILFSIIIQISNRTLSECRLVHDYN